MPRGRKPKAGGLRPDQRKGMKTLEKADNPTIPPMPKAEDWIPVPQGPAEETELDFEPEWAKPVQDWWQSIWTSPMSSEFVDSDIHGLYMACVYMHESLNPYLKVADRIKNAQAWESTIAKYGLTPTARESLRWQVAQGTQAQNRTDQLRSQKKVEPAPNYTDNPNSNIVNMYKQFG